MKKRIRLKGRIRTYIQFTLYLGLLLLAIAKSFTEIQGGKFRIELDGDLFKVVLIWKVKQENKEPENANSAQMENK